MNICFNVKPSEKGLHGFPDGGYGCGIKVISGLIPLPFLLSDSFDGFDWCKKFVALRLPFGIPECSVSVDYVGEYRLSGNGRNAFALEYRQVILGSLTDRQVRVLIAKMEESGLIAREGEKRGVQYRQTDLYRKMF